MNGIPSSGNGLVVERRSASLIGKAKCTGFEPASGFDTTGNLPCGCVICDECRAALALHPEFLKWLALALHDADLQAVLAKWDTLPGSIRKAMMALLNS
jgi:hypothetical protein